MIALRVKFAGLQLVERVCWPPLGGACLIGVAVALFLMDIVASLLRFGVDMKISLTTGRMSTSKLSTALSSVRIISVT